VPLLYIKLNSLQLRSTVYNNFVFSRTTNIFSARRKMCPPVHINDAQIPQENHVKYLGLHLDRHLTWHTHFSVKHKQLGLSLTKMYWLLGRKSKLSTNNKLLIYKPIWTYGIQLWGTTSNSNIEILESFQSRVLWLIVNAP
jgi:hypothetical protein